MSRRIVFALLLVFLVALPADAGELAPRPIKSIGYYEGSDADPIRHRLDLYVPKNTRDFPVLFFIHGGGWVYGTKEYYGVMPAFARSFTRNGIGVVSINYRLSPRVQHPEHIRDVARAFAWTYQHIGEYGGCKNEIFVAGHSAGGHLAALLGTDESYLKQHKLSLAAIRGVIPISGIFILPTMEPFLNAPFGRDSTRRVEASPINHICKDCPPFLITYAEREFPHCDGPGATAFCKELRALDLLASTYKVPNRNHLSIFLSAIWDTDPLAQAMLGFIMTHATLERLKTDPGHAVSRFGDFIDGYLDRKSLRD